MSNSRPDGSRLRHLSPGRLAEFVLESSADFAIFTLDLGGMITSWNSAAERIMGWSAAEAIGQDACMIFTAEDQAEGGCQGEMAGARASGRAVDERWHLRKDGSRFWGAGSMTRLEDETGEQIGYAKIVRDRTEQHEAGERLRASEALLRAIAENGGDCLKLLLPDGRLTFMNDAGLRALEIDNFEQVRDKAWVSLWPAAERPKVEAALAEAVAGRIGRFQGLCPTVKGQPRWWDVQVTSVPGSKGHPGLLAAASRDVTERHTTQEALRRSEERLRTAFGISTVGVLFWGPDFGLTEANDAFLRMTGFSREETLGISWRELTPPEFYSVSLQAIAQVTTTGEAEPYEKQYVRKDGSRFWGLFAPRRISGDEIVEFVLDITDRKLAEEALRAREAELALVADALPVLIGFVGSDLVYRFANQAYREWFYLDPQQVVGRTVRDITPADMFEMRLPFIERALAGEMVVFENLWPHLDGRHRMAETRYLPRRAATGQIDGFYVLVIDITQRHTTEQTLRLTAGDLERQVAERTADRDRMWQLSSDIMLVAGFDGLIQAINPAWRTLLGWDEAELVGRSFLDLVHPDDLGATLAEMDRSSKGLATLRFENRYRAKNGSHVTLSWTAVPDAQHIHAVGRDVTADREQAEALRATEEALRQSQKMEAVGQLTGGIAHDFNNLLTSISGSLELLKSRVAQGRLGDLDRYLGFAQGAADRAAALTHRLLAFSQRQTLDPKPTDANRLVDGMEELVRRTAGPEITLEVALAPDLWPTLCDPNQLENAVLNLCINARDAMPHGGRLTIETINVHMDGRGAQARDLEPGEYVAISVSDTGTGMPPDVVARAFDPFFTTKPFGQGTGLGLSMIYGFVRQSGGQIRIHSEVSVGTTMRLYLPRHDAQPEHDDARTDLAEAPRAQQGETVLVVDDEPALRMLMADVLEELGYGVIQAGDGASGLQILQAGARIDLLVTDVGLPGGLNGRQMADAARQFRPDLKVLFITGYAEHAVIGNGRLEPGMHVVTKPFAMETLASRIKELISAAPP